MCISRLSERIPGNSIQAKRREDKCIRGVQRILCGPLWRCKRAQDVSFQDNVYI